MKRHSDLVQFGPSFALSSSENSKAGLGSRARNRASSQLAARFHLLHLVAVAELVAVLPGLPLLGSSC